MSAPIGRRKWERIYALITFTATIAVTVFVFLILYQVDNKYTAGGPKAEGGVLTLDARTLAEHPALLLTDGWEYYGGRLLSPDDFAQDAPNPDATIFIGQYGGFDAGDRAASSHGSATYRLTITVPGEPAQYALELPEIFSAYRAYVNGRLVQTMGDPDPASYRPETGNRTASIYAGGRIELVIAVSDFSHIYSGLTYPPAFGEPAAVSGLLSARLIFRSMLVMAALAIGLLALFIGLRSGRNRLAMLFGLLCLFFIGYTAYPLIQTLTSAFYPFYAIENISFCAMLLTVVLLQRDILTQQGRWGKLPLWFGVCMCFASAVLPFLLPGGESWVMAAYSYSVMGYEWLTAAFLTMASALSVWRGDLHSRALMGGILVFDVSLIMDRLLPLHEPIVTGWFPELASFALVLCIGAIVASEVAAKYRDNAVLTERARGLERLTEMHRTNYELLTERIEETKTIQHDLRHHFIMMDGFLQNRDYEGLKAYIRKFRPTIQDAEPLEYSRHPVVNVLLRHYGLIAKKAGIRLALKPEIGQDVGVSETDLCALLSNLLENAVESCERQTEGARFISLSMACKATVLVVQMENSASEPPAGQGGRLTSSKAADRKGYGLDSIRTIAASYGGEAEFEYDTDKKMFISTVMLMTGGRQK
ncbi:hypothetical protein AGMMS49983_19960 [Clostridia bacterium]|nr:hypothetical protein AGMMS49983_19960 [Clostridia bacterium]